MVSCREDPNLVYDIKLLSAAPGRLTGSDVIHELSGMDLAMKLSYLKGVYFFNSQACQGLTIMQIKGSMFYWLNDYYTVCGRFQRTEAGRPYMKCNDCGVRIVEARCSKTVDEWLETRDCSLDNLLIYHSPIGPELFFSPSLYMQVTKFKCGGMSLGISWAHIIGDVYSASECLNSWGQFLAGLKSYGPLKLTKSPTGLAHSRSPSVGTKEPVSLTRVDPVGDLWVTANNCQMETFSFHLSASQVSQLHSRIRGQSGIAKIPFFESLCAIMWQCIAKAKDGLEPKVVTLCKKDPSNPKDGILSNSQIISSVKADSSVVDADLKELATLLVDQTTEENSQIEEAVEKDNGVFDYVVYGAKLTLVDLEETNFYGLEWNGHKPEAVHYSIQGVGDEGAVMVLPWPKDSGTDGNIGRIVVVTLPENEVVKLRFELRKNGLILEDDYKAD
ncbi:protein ECERIFERUM 26-like [Populus alba x Populus x berolinensis]|uniref:Protein ECERIFERUM 26-like n=1 Tax=Populus alba x Populus x berolinensis TaxID=444605 RepID=A0AAD6RRD2_9ROSI|nr:protein ECERIFERUM 26-like [Populus alba x Populus x berolinensis]